MHHVYVNTLKLTRINQETIRLWHDPANIAPVSEGGVRKR